MIEEREPYRRGKRPEDGMDLPDGKTCGDCVHCRRCTLIFGHIPADEVCDWFPSRFRARERIGDSDQNRLVALDHVPISLDIAGVGLPGVQ